METKCSIKKQCDFTETEAIGALEFFNVIAKDKGSNVVNFDDDNGYLFDFEDHKVLIHKEHGVWGMWSGFIN